MKSKYLMLTILLSLIICVSELHSQTLIINQTNESQIDIALDNIQKITFGEDNMNIYQMDNSNDVYALNELNSLIYSDSNINYTEDILNSKEQLIAYPNPSNDFVTINLCKKLNVNGTLTLINVNGETVLTKQLNKPQLVRLNISHLSNGIYLCLFKNELEYESVKIVKQ